MSGSCQLIRPHIFLQVFTILGLVVRSGTDAEDPDTPVSLPLVYALLPSKTEVHYTLVLQKVKEAAARFCIRAAAGPTKIMTDFEMGIINAARAGVILLPEGTEFRAPGAVQRCR